MSWRPSASVTAILIVLTFGSFAVVQGIKLQQLSLLVSGLIATSAAALTVGHLALAGFLLALATIKPQLAVPVVMWLALWAFSDLRQRWRFLGSLGVTLALLLAASEYILPGWIGRFRDAIAAYRQYTGGAGSLLDVLTTPLLGKVIAAVAVVAVVGIGWQLRRVAADSAAFSAMLALVLTVTLMIVPSFAPYNQMFLLPAVFLIVRSWRKLWNPTWLPRAACVISALIVFWPWLASSGLMLASLLLPAMSVQSAWAAPLYTSLGIPIVVSGLLTMCVIDVLKSPFAPS